MADNTSVAATVPRQPAPTAAEIAAARTPQGGWTAAQLEAWGVPWPPPKGWLDRLQTEASMHADGRFLTACNSLLLAIATNSYLEEVDADALLEAMPDFELRQQLYVGLKLNQLLSPFFVEREETI